ncbi:hypothetical protein ACIQ7N_14835 [Lysinibacillus sp. NPDC095746]
MTFDINNSLSALIPNVGDVVNKDDNYGAVITIQEVSLQSI